MNEIFDLSVSFGDLGLRDSVVRGVDDAGFEHPTTIQAQLIPLIMQGSDVMGQAKTGTGKTAAFGLPVLHGAEKDGGVQALILAPTRELAMQIVQELNELGRHTPINAAGIIGGDSFRKQIKALQGGAQIAVGTPGRVMDLHRRGQISFDHIRWVVLDEVDRMLDIGFRDDIRRILGTITGEHQTIFVSATISDEIERLGRRFMRDDVQRITTVADSLTVSLVTQKYLPVQRHDKRRLLLHLLRNEDPALTVVFCRMKATVRDVARYLKQKGIDAHEIHGDMHQRKRNRVMTQLRGGKLEVLIASDLAARGLDVQGITHVINYDLPEDPEVYVHRIGRTARTGASGTAWSFVEPTEGQRLTEIEKLTGVLIEQLEYPDFKPSEPRQRDGDGRGGRSTGRSSGRGGRDESDASSTEPKSTQQTAERDSARFPGGVVPTGPPKRTLGSRFRTRRSR
jgi:ATP-dependent RNA helicase DeaD